MKKAKGRDEYIRGVLSFARQFEYAQQKHTSEFLYEVADFLKSIDEQPKVGEWIPCSERLPETSEPVLVFTDSYTQEIWSLIKDEDGDYWEDDYGYGQLIRDAIAWMPLPEPYRKDVE